MGIRDQFKATAMSDLENQQKQVDEIFNFGGGDYLSLDEGKNKIRIFPKHPGEGNLFIYPKGVHFLPIEVTEEDGSKKIKRKPVWSGLIHSEAKSCIVDEYIARVYKLAGNFSNKADREKFLARLSGKTGITMSRTWPVYANKITAGSKKFGILELKPSVKNKMNELAANSDDSSAMITTDPFTDPDNGRAVFVTYDSKADKPEDYYKVGIDFVGPTPLSDAELEAFEKVKPLGEIYQGVYKRSDFMLAIEGLKRFDEEAEDYNIFSQDDWADVMERFSELYPEASEEVEEETTTKKEEKPTKQVVETKTETQKKDDKKDTSWIKTVDEMDKDELVAYIKKEKLPVKPLPGDTVEEIRSLVNRELKLREIELTQKVETKEEEESGISDEALDFLKD